MTYCLAVRLDEGLVFLADTRTNAGVDNVGTYRKLHEIPVGPDRVFVLQSAGNLATTQQVLDYINRDLTAGPGVESLATVNHLFEAALYIGRLSQQVVGEHLTAFGGSSAATATFILGGQVAGEEPDILLIYPEGNYVRASEERPFLQIGETKYGKYLLDLAVRTHVDITTATKIALGSMMSTTTANLSVGPPFDLGIYRKGATAVDQYRITADSKVLVRLRELWERHVLNIINELPNVSLTDG